MVQKCPDRTVSANEPDTENDKKDLDTQPHAQTSSTNSESDGAAASGESSASKQDCIRPKHKSTDSNEPGKGDGHNDEPQAKTPKVLSANDWESAELSGGDDRKAKFLRLMGASKKDHKGTFVIGDSVPHKEHLKSPDERSGLEDKLSEQYIESMEANLARKDAKHRGLGYHGNSEAELAGTVASEPSAENKTSTESEPSAENKTSTESELSTIKPAIDPKTEDEKEGDKYHDVTKDRHMHFVSADGKKVDM